MKTTILLQLVLLAVSIAALVSGDPELGIAFSAAASGVGLGSYAARNCA